MKWSLKVNCTRHICIPGPLAILLVLCCQPILSAQSPPMDGPVHVEQWDLFEARFEGPDSGNPYVDVSFVATFEQPAVGLAMHMPGFYDGNGIYKIRFMPPQQGPWQYRTTSNQPQLDGKAGMLFATRPSAGNHGPVRVHATYHFAYADGKPFFPVGTTCYAWIHQPQPLQQQTLSTLAASPFNKLRMCIFPKWYAYNRDQPRQFPFQQGPDGKLDFTRFNPVFWQLLEQRLLGLCRIGVEADIILWHPYDCWGLAEMDDQADDRYLRYAIARLWAFRNVWWSLANEYDAMAPTGRPQGHAGNKTMEDWDRFFQILQNEDPGQHLRSIHNMRGFYDHSRPWVTHASIQHNGDLRQVLDWRERYKKPIVVDECGYEGNIPQGWGKLTPQELVRRFWVGTVSGGYVGHGETYQHPGDILWWSKGGRLYGQSPPRITFLRQFMQALPWTEMTPSRLDPNVLVLAKPGSVYLVYALSPGHIEMTLDGNDPYQVEAIDPWQMKIGRASTVPPGRFSFDIPQADYLLRIIARPTRQRKVSSRTEDLQPDPQVWGQWQVWGDQGDGTYCNPILPADFSDIDCIRVGTDYYAISSTFQYSPGMTILHSKDLVNWQIIGHAVWDITQIDPNLNWDCMNRNGRGIWAGAIRYHADKFWVYFGTPDEGYFMTTATDPAGPWEPLHRMTSSPGWDDCCPFWDEDGQGWFVGTHFADNYKTYLYKLTPDGRDIIANSAVLINEGRRREANKLYKINGVYYHLFNEFSNGSRYLMMQRAKSITGPYKQVRQLMAPQRRANEPNQGGLVTTPDGRWFFFTHHGTGSWEGRAVSLLPVTWVDGWPIPGQLGPDGLGYMLWTATKPVIGLPKTIPATCDGFDGPQLGPQWQWHYQPRPDKWSLAHRPGFLRLYAFRPLEPDNILKAGNTLTHRAFRTPRNIATVRIELAGMADGQVAGLAHLSSGGSAELGIRQQAGKRRVFFRSEGKTIEGPEFQGQGIWLQTIWGLDGISRFAISLDGMTFEAIGGPYQMRWRSYRGSRLALFSYNNDQEAGWVDIDWFSYELAGQTVDVAHARQ